MITHKKKGSNRRLLLCRKDSLENKKITDDTSKLNYLWTLEIITSMNLKDGGELKVNKHNLFEIKNKTN